MARVLVAYYSRSGLTARLAQVLVDEMRRCGNEVAAEAIRADREWSRWLLPVPLLPLLPLLPVYLLSASFRSFWHRTLFQPVQAIRPIAIADVSGLSWGITRLRGGFLIATLARDKRELHDSKFAVRAVKDHIARFGNAPRAYAYDRGGWSEANVNELKRLGVRDIGLAPRGRARWQVSDRAKEKLVSERAQVEGGIGTIKCGKYGFNRPAARSVATMGGCGQRAVLGYNLNKLVRGLAARREVVLVG